MISVRKASVNDLDFLIECFNHSHEKNDYAYPFAHYRADFLDEAMFQKFKNYLLRNLCDQDIFIVFKNNKDIGFFYQELDDVNSHVGGATFVHPHACKMSVITMGICATIRGTLYGNRYDYKYGEFNVWHPLLSQTVRKIIPNIREIVIYPEYRILFIPFEDIDFEHFSKVCASYGLTNLDKDFCFDLEGL